MKTTIVFLILIIFSLLIINSTQAQSDRSPYQLDSLLTEADSMLYNFNWDAAAELYASIRENIEKADDANLSFRLYMGIANLYDYISSYDSAMYYFDRCLEISEATGDSNVNVFIGVARIYKALDYYDEAMSYYDIALDLNERVGIPLNEGIIKGEIGNIYRTQGYAEKALDYYKMALEISKREGDKYSEIAWTANIGLANSNLGNYDTALAYYNQALRYDRETGDKRSEATDLGNIGVLYEKTGNYSKALEVYEEALDISKEIGDIYQEANQLSNIGGIYCNYGDFGKGLDYFEQAIEIFKDNKIKNGEAVVLLNIAVLYEELDEREVALAKYKEVLNIADETDNIYLKLTVFSNMGGVYTKLDDNKRAFQYFNEALEIAQELKDYHSVVICLSGIAGVHFDVVEYEKALEYYQNALRLSEELGLLKTKGELLALIGQTYHFMKDYEISIRYTEEALSIHEKLGVNDEVRRGYLALALNYYKLEKYDTAYSYCKRSIGTTESLREKLKSSKQKTSFFKTAHFMYELSVLVAYNLYERDGDSKYLEEAFGFSESFRCRSFLDQLAEAKATLRQGIPPELLEKEKDIMARLAWLAEKIDETSSQGYEVDTLQFSKLKSELFDKEQDLDKLRISILEQSPRYGDLQYPEPASIQDIQQSLLDDRTALLEYTIVDSISFLWCITSDSFNLYYLPGNVVINQVVLALRDEITLPRLFSPEFLNLSNELYTWLIKPCENDITHIDNLVIVPDGVLNYLPFELLIQNIDSLTDSLSYDKLNYLVKDYNVSYVQSATVLTQIRKHPKGSLDDMKGFVAFADPHYEVSTPHEDVTPVRNTGAIVELTRQGYSSLPSTKIEVERIAELFPTPERDLFLESEASEENVKEIDNIKNYKYVHFACHGLFNEEFPEFSGLVLSMQPENSRENGYLQMYEIYNLDLHADLVTLSACETGLGKIVEGEGIMSLTRAFMYAGTPSVLVSLWSIADASTAEFMYQFYDNLVNDNMNKAQALREAKLKMIKSEKYNHPFYWAPFVLIGDR